MIKSDEIHISSKDPKKLALFYRDVLGWTMTGDSPDFDSVCFEGHGNNPTVWIWDERKHGKKNSGAVHFMYDCLDPDMMYQNLVQKGAELDPPKVVSWSGKGIHVIDPDGNRILMLQ